MSNILENMKERLLHYINKNDSSSFVKKLKILSGEMEEVKNAFEDIDKVKNLKEAFGKSLDNYGSNVGEMRKGNDDKLYRLLIRIKIAENTSDASINHIVNALSLAIDRPLEEIYVREGWNFIDDQQPAAIYVSFPSEVFGDYNITYDRFIQLFNNVVGGGISTDFFVIEEEQLNIAATLPYTEFSTLPFCDTINTGQWADQTTGEIYEAKAIETFTTKDQELPFLAGFFSGDENISYPDATVDKMNVLEGYSKENQVLPFAGSLYSGDHEEFFNEGKGYAAVLSLAASQTIFDKAYNFCDTFKCGEVAV